MSQLDDALETARGELVDAVCQNRSLNRSELAAYNDLTKRKRLLDQLLAGETVGNRTADAYGKSVRETRDGWIRKGGRRAIELLAGELPRGYRCEVYFASSNLLIAPYLQAWKAGDRDLERASVEIPIEIHVDQNEATEAEIGEAVEAAVRKGMPRLVAAIEG